MESKKKWINNILTRRFLYLLLFFITIYLCWEKPTNVFFTTFFSSFFLLRLIFCLKRSFIRNFLVINLLMICFITLFINYKYGDISTSMIMSVIGVNAAVSMGTVKTFGVSFALLFISILSILLFLTINISKARYSLKEKFLLIFTILILLCKPLLDGGKHWGYKFYLNNIKYSPTFVSQPYLDQFKIFFGPVISAISVYTENALNTYKYNKVKHRYLPEYVSIDKSNKQVKNIVYVIGESSNPGRYAIYGYGEKTTPNLSRMKEENKICLFFNVHSPAAQTRLAVPMLTSLESPRERKNLFKYKNLIEMAQSQTFKTYWFDAQMQNNMWNKPFGYIAQYAEVLQTPEGNNTGFTLSEGQDEKLMPAIEHYFRQSSGKNFFVIHLMGNHLPYGSFQTTPDVTFKDPYDTSVYQVDSMLNKIISLSDKYLKEYQLVYISDHGEVVGSGHGYPTKDNEMYRIPFLMTSSDYCDDVQNFRSSSGELNSNMIKFLILKMLGYSVSNKKLADEKNHSQLILNEKEEIINYDNLNNMPLLGH